jgi:DNA-binding CsgD family transcriptional regulator
MDEKLPPEVAAEIWPHQFDDAAAVDPEWLSAIIGDIYDCVLDPSRWRAVIETVALYFSFNSAALALLQMRHGGSSEALTQFGFDAEWLACMADYREDAALLWGGLERVAAFPLDEPIVCSEVMPRSRFPENRYYRDVLEPRGLYEGVMITLARSSESYGCLALNRPTSAGDLSPADRQGLRLLAPHLRRAVTISDLFDLKAVERLTFHAVLETMRHAVILVDELAAIVHINEAAKSLLVGSALVEARGGRLRLSSHAAQSALEVALELAANDEARLAQRGISVPLGGAPNPFVLHVMPLRRTELRRGLGQRAVAAVFIVPATRRAEPPLDAVSLLYDLTPAETQIFALISEGKTLAEISHTLGVGRGTAKTHLLRVFSKTGCRRQAELVALANSLSLPV